MAKNFDSYNDVATRIREFIDKHPEGSLQQLRLEIITIGEQLGVLYVAAAYRHPGDDRPGVGTAFEPVPAVNPGLRGSEVMVAETSAWGRALVAIGADTKKGIASANEVQARTPETQHYGAQITDWLTRANELSFTGEVDKLRELYDEAISKKAPGSVIRAIADLGKDLAK
jgi:hypothetical protein